jgi:protease PrsW
LGTVAAPMDLPDKPPPVPDPMPASTASGWYQDPWEVDHWRWWNGRSWTGHIYSGTQHAPRLPAWLSPLVLVFGVLSTLSVVVLAFVAPVAVALGCVPLLIVLPALHWIDRMEPEPWSSRVHALLWGATVAAFVSGLVNTAVDMAAGTTLAAVVSAPLIEELTKGLGVVWAVRRKEIDGVMDGVVYAGWVGLGFAIVEDFQYFAIAQGDDVLVVTFVIRALMTPFLHPLFTAFTGLAIGRALVAGRAMSTAWWGFALAALTHAAWNGSLTAAESVGDGGGLLLLVSFAGFFVLFVTAVGSARRLRHDEEQHYNQIVPLLARRYGLSEPEIARFGDWHTVLRERKELDRSARTAYDAMHEALARLALFHARTGAPESAEESRLMQQMQVARQQLADG